MKRVLPLLAILAASAASAATDGIQNGGFENNVVSSGGYLYAEGAGAGVPTVGAGQSPAANWNFSNYAGVSANATAWSPSQVATEGGAYAFVQSYNGEAGSISQAFALSSAVSALNVTFDSAQRIYGSDIQTLAVSVLSGNTVVASQSYTPTQAWGNFSLDVGALAAGAYTLKFSGATGLSGDRSVFVDNVSLRSTSAVPEADAVALALAGVTMVGVLVRRRRQA